MGKTSIYLTKQEEKKIKELLNVFEGSGLDNRSRILKIALDRLYNDVMNSKKVKE